MWIMNLCMSRASFSRRAVVSYWRKYVHEVLVNRLGGLSLPRKSVVRLTDRPDMTVDVYRGRKTTIQQYNNEPGKNEADPMDYLSRHPLPDTEQDNTEKIIKALVTNEHE